MNAVSRRLGQRLLPVEVVAIGGAFLFLSFDDGGAKCALLLEQFSYFGPRFWRLIDRFRQDIACAGKSCIDVVHTFLRIDEHFSLRDGIERGILLK